MSAYNEYLRFYDHLADLIYLRCYDLKNKIPHDDPKYMEKRDALNKQRDEDYRKLRKFFFGKRAERTCKDCEFYANRVHDRYAASGFFPDIDDDEGEQHEQD